MLVLKLPREQKMQLAEHIQTYFASEFSQEIGNLAAENLIDFMVKKLGPVVYNQAIGDARALVMQQMERFDEELYTMEQPTEFRSYSRDGDL